MFVNYRNQVALSVFVAGLATSFVVSAQDLPAGLMKTTQASEGKTEVAKSGFEAAPDKPASDEKLGTELKLSAGGLLSTGNSRSTSLTAAGKFKMRREDNQLSAAAASNFSRSAAKPEDSTETTVENYQGRVRYDRFFSSGVAGFLGASALRDRFQGLDLRLNIDPGVAYYMIDAKSHQLWTELGYDLQHDVRRDEALAAAAAAGSPSDKSETRHNMRMFFGYDNSLNEAVTLNTGLEYIQNFAKTESWRLGWDIGLTSSIAQQLAIATTFSLKYDHNPLPKVEETDAITSISIVYTML